MRRTIKISLGDYRAYFKKYGNNRLIGYDQLMVIVTSSKFDLTPIFTEEDVLHWFIPQVTYSTTIQVYIIFNRIPYLVNWPFFNVFGVYILV